ncbi:MAG: FHA domain-containing protein [Gammaproteobacteria bacterium]|nr:FHA domain-containing protein [Gammaproteobacteria bacterium]
MSPGPRREELPVGVHFGGQAPECAIRLRGAGIAPRHLRIEMAPDGTYRLADLGGSAGTRVNGERVVVAAGLGGDDILRVGDTEFTVHLAPSPKAGPLPMAVWRPDRPPLAADRASGLFIEAANRAHRQLLRQLDLRRRDVSAMDDRELRAIATELLRPIAEEEGSRSSIDASQLHRFVLDEALGLGPLEALLADDDIREIMVNGPEQIFVESAGRLRATDARFSSETALRGIVERIVTPIGRRVDESSPMVDARLPDGSRVNIVVPPLALRGTALTIRRFGRSRLGAAQLLERGTLDEAMLEFLRCCVLLRRNMLVSGGTGSGKTTLLNVLSALIPPGERVVTIEDSAELAFDHANLVALETRPRNIEGRGEVTVRDLVRNALRMRPDRLVIGECRGGETLDMLQAMNTGHDGSLSTVHANSPRELLSRLEVMVLMSGVELPLAAIREQIASSVHLIIHQARLSCGTRRITHITEITGVTAGVVQTQDIFRHTTGRGFHATGHVPQFLEGLGSAAERPDLRLFRDHGGLMGAA